MISGMDLTEALDIAQTGGTGTGTESTAPTRGTERERDTESGTGVHGTERGSTTGSGAGAETERSIENTTRIGTDTETEKEKGNALSYVSIKEVFFFFFEYLPDICHNFNLPESQRKGL